MKLLSRVWFFVTPRTIDCQVPPSLRFFRQEYWSGLPFPSPSKKSPLTLFFLAYQESGQRWGWRMCLWERSLWVVWPPSCLPQAQPWTGSTQGCRWKPVEPSAPGWSEMMQCRVGLEALAASSDGPRKGSSPLPPSGMWPHLELADLTWEFWVCFGSRGSSEDRVRASLGEGAEAVGNLPGQSLPSPGSPYEPHIPSLLT